MEELLVSTAWKRQKGEDLGIFSARIESQKVIWQNMVRTHGNCYMVKFGVDDVRPMWEDQISVEKLRELVSSPLGIPHSCPLCQPYDYFDTTTKEYDNRRHMTRIINPKYPDGFVDKDGVLAKCVCLINGENRKRLKFQGMRLQ